ncbi:Metacaspase-1A [Rhizoctonia solani]|uniref:Metacaspase-1A n=1 Tax=Rhizoctonia solani TaxID=456999 RepID=A0A0K6GB88_9AGAM|nr:Metacaspase-1A [Rhizoctonia solani]
MNHRKYICSRYESGIWYTSGTVAPAILKRSKRPVEDEGDEKPIKRRTVHHISDYTQGSTPYKWHHDTQGSYEQASTMLPHPPNKAPVNLRISVPERGRNDVPYLAQQEPTSSSSYYHSLYDQDHIGNYSHGTPSSLSGWHFFSPLDSSSLSPSPHSPEVTRHVLRASSSYDVQRHQVSRQHSFAEYVDYYYRNDLPLPRQYATSPNSPLFPPAVHYATHSSGEEDNNFEPSAARSMSPEPFSRRDSHHAPECVVSSSLGSDADLYGKRRALIIVLEYGAGQMWKDSTSVMRIQGPYGDGEDIYRLLLEQGYHEDEITVMKDLPNTPFEFQPTCANIKYQLGRLVAGAAPGDRFFLYYAGHGFQVNDINGDEADGLDEAIIPSDWATAYNYSDEGLIIDDYLKEACVNPLPKGAHLTAVFDCCHAGTIMDLTYEHSAKQSGLGFKLNVLTGLSSRRLPSKYRSVDGRVLCISACEDDQRAYQRGYMYQRGLLTEAFTQCIRGFAKSYQLAGVAFRLNPTLKRLYEYLFQHGRPDPEKHGYKYIQDPMLATTFKLSVAEYHRPLLI